MTLATKMHSLEGKGRFAIWKRTSSPQDLQVVRKDIRRYLSEPTKAGVDKAAVVAQRHPNFLKAGIDYLTKEDQGKLKVYGFLRDDIIRLRGRFPHRMKNDELVEATMAALESRLRRKDIKRVAHKYVLSLNPEFCDVLNQTRHGVDELLTQSVRKVMRKYQEKYYPKDRIGYVVGIHHDKAHVHAHVMLFPTTENGKLLRISDESRKRGGRSPFKDMRENAAKDVKNFYYREIKNPIRASERDVQKYSQPKILAFACEQRAKRHFKGQDDVKEETRVAWIHQERERLMRGPESELQEAMREGYEFARQRFNLIRGGLRGKDKAKAEQAFVVLEEDARTINTQIGALFKELKELKAQGMEASRARRELYQDMSNWKHYRYNASAIAEGGYSLRDQEVGSWVEKTLNGGGDLGRMVQDWIDERHQRNEEVNLPKEMLRLAASGETPVAAMKFTEKDKFARKCITYGAGKVKDQTLTMLEHYYRQDAFLTTRSQKDFVREFISAELKARRDELAAVAQRRETIQKQIRELRTLQQARQIDREVVKCVFEKKEPGFLAEYRGWQVVGADIPTGAIRTFAEVTQPEETVKRSIDPDDYHSRVQQSLRLLRQRQMGDELFTTRHYGDGTVLSRDPTAGVQSARARILDEGASRDAALAFLGSRPDALRRVELPNAESVEERRKRVRERYMEQTPDSAIDR